MRNEWWLVVMFVFPFIGVVAVLGLIRILIWGWWPCG